MEQYDQIKVKDDIYYYLGEGVITTLGIKEKLFVHIDGRCSLRLPLDKDFSELTNSKYRIKVYNLIDGEMVLSTFINLATNEINTNYCPLTNMIFPSFYRKIVIDNHKNSFPEYYL